jgi:hypothetical protein
MRVLGILVSMAAAGAVDAQAVQVTDGKVFDRLASVVVDGPSIVGVFERTTAPGPGFEGNLHLLRSTDGGSTFSNPLQPLQPALAARHPCLLKVGGQWQLYFEAGLASNDIVVRRALSVDGSTFALDPSVALGWATGPHRRPFLASQPDGALLLSYERNDTAYLAVSTDQGASFDQLRTPTATGANFARIATWGGQFVLVYESSSQPSRIGLKQTSDVRQWPSDPVWLTPPDWDAFQAMPVALGDGSLVIYYAAIAPGEQRPDLYSRSTRDGIHFAPARQETSGNFSEAQPFVYARREAGRVGLFYSKSASPCGSSYCYLFWDRDLRAGEETVLGDGFEAP